MTSSVADWRDLPAALFIRREYEANFWSLGTLGFPHINVDLDGDGRKVGRKNLLGGFLSGREEEEERKCMSDDLVNICEKSTTGSNSQTTHKTKGASRGHRPHVVGVRRAGMGITSSS